MKINPVRSSHGVLNPAFAIHYKHSSPQQAAEYSASNGINELLIKASQQLKKKNIASAALDAEVLLSFVLNKSREFLFKNPNQKITGNKLQSFNALIKRRSELEPIAYLIQKKEFYGLDFYVDQRVLIPRPETEILVEEILKITDKDAKITIADIGTGSGCLAVTLAKYLPQVKITAIDISKNAVEVAIKNAKKHKASSRIRFFTGDLLQPLIHSVDIIVANLPYLSKEDWNKEIKYEPFKALVARKRGLEYLEKLLAQAPAKLNSKGKFFLEIQPTQLKLIKAAALANFPKARIKAIKDLAGFNRIIELTL